MNIKIKINEAPIKKIIIFIESILLVALGMDFTANTVLAEKDETSIANVLLDDEKVTVTENIQHPGTVTYAYP